MKKGVDYIGVSAGAMIVNDKGEIFLSKRSQKATNERGCWETPGGGVDFGETLEEAAKREIREEYGVDIEIIEQFPAADHFIPNEKQHWVATTFLAKMKPGETPKIMEPEKCDAIRWFSLDNLPSPLSLITQHDIEVYTKRLAEEKVDIVDDEDNVLYSTTKVKAHELGLLHRTVIAEVIDDQGRLILVKQAADRQDAGQYVSPVGGHVQAGETEEAALEREAFEELGIKHFTFTHKGKVIFNRKVLGRQENHYFIVFEIVSNQEITLNHESVGYEVFTPAQLGQELRDNSLKFGDAFHFIVKTFYKEWLG